MYNSCLCRTAVLESLFLRKGGDVLIKLNHVSFSYQNGEANEMQVLSDVSFQASRGECVVLCGKSGCGKTTMLRLVNGLIPHFYAGKLEGNVLVGGQEMQQTPLPHVPDCGKCLPESPYPVFPSGYDRRDGF